MPKKLINETIFEFDEIDKEITGHVTAVTKHQFKPGEPELNVYHMRTDDDQRVSFICGRPTDMSIAYMDIVGEHVTFKFLGQKEIKEGHKMNVFEIYLEESEKK